MKILFMILFLLVVESCYMVGTPTYPVPLTGRFVDNSTIRLFQMSTKHSAKVAIYIDKKTRDLFISKKAEGFIGGGALWQIPIGEAFSNALIDAFNALFIDVIILEKISALDDRITLLIKAENVDVGFEFSAAAKKPPGMMDRGRVSLSINTIGLGTGNVDKFNIKYRFSEEEIDNTAPPASHAGVLEKCVIKIAFLYVQQVKALL